MTPYLVAKFVHVVTLLAAIAASAIIHLALHRRDRARTAGEMLEWHMLVIATARTFPIALLVLVLSGSYMISAGALRAWSSGFVIAGLVGVALLLVAGAFLGVKAKGLKTMLEGLIQQAGEGAPAPSLRPGFLATLPWINLAIVLGVVFDMVTKPPLVAALAIPAAAAVAVFALAALARRPRPAPDASTA